MSEKERVWPPKMDPRVRQTRDALGDALVQLMQQKPFDSITVQEVLDRAGVSRSTFYVHYRDKDDLFLSDADEFFESMAKLLVHRREDSERIVPAREMFAHLTDVQRFYSALVESGRFHDVMRLGQAHFAKGIEARLAGMPQARVTSATERAAVAWSLSGAFWSMVTWWIDRGIVETPAEMDDLYHDMVWKGLRSATSTATG